mmetsp:Transcript_26543/g.61399  ORF Transcript_26543/g.61399 Transcript_26543/m.61399 type:complete len:212 (+) Transcript_26543:202-837(+)
MEKVWRQAVLQVVREVQARQVPPLPRLPSVHPQDGPPLPMDLQLRRVPQPQVLLPAAVLLGLGVPLHHLDDVGDGLEVRRPGHALQHHVPPPLRGDPRGLRRHPRHGLLRLPRVADALGHDHHRVLREAVPQHGARRADQLRPRALRERQGRARAALLALALADLAAGGLGSLLRVLGPDAARGRAEVQGALLRQQHRAQRGRLGQPQAGR